MEGKRPFLANLRRIDSLSTFSLYTRDTILVVTFGFQLIKTFNVVLYIIFLCISNWTTLVRFKTKLEII